MTTHPWRLRAGERKALRFLEYLADADETWVASLEGLGVAADDLWAFLRDLEGEGLVELQSRRNMRLADIHPDARLTGVGAAHVEEVRERRADAIARARACRTELLTWLYGVSESMPVTTDVLHQEPEPTFYCDPFAEPEVQSAARHLLDAGLIRGVTSWQSGGAPLRAALTNEGQRCVEEFDADPSAYGRSTSGSTSQPMYVQHNYQPTGPLAQGEHAQAVTHQGLTPKDLRAVHETFIYGVQSVKDAEVREEAQEALEDLMDDLRAEHVEPRRIERRLGRLERIANRVGDATLKAATSEGARRVMELLAGAL